ncbi:LytTR family DNA-binding domain-containing protein [Ruegeria faecimaris]|uniref:LytTR family DNA-binding domain-containing protein n=1 Tax=Ruegeria faecimaris TaxID=686389 RepID=UPI00232C98BF|nr:LytTR family DNA-binding domain-containing protein [Ruegeria faecimaris]
MKPQDVYNDLKQAELSFVVLPGMSVDAILSEVLSFFLSRNFLMFLPALMLLLLGATPSLFAEPLNGLGRSIYWMFGLLGYMGSVVLMLLFEAVCSRYLGIKRFFTPLTCFPVAYGAMKFAQFATTMVFSTFLSFSFENSPLLLPQYFLVVGIEVIVIVWVFPPYLARLRAGDPQPEDEPDSRVESRVPVANGLVSANGQNFLAKDILFVQAQQHYVTLRVDEKEVLVRSTFKGILSQMPECYGLQVHRSFWVANRCVDIAKSLNEVGYLVLGCGKKIAIARSRHGAVRDWLSEMASAESPATVKASQQQT